jgi:hypothetical protein
MKIKKYSPKWLLNEIKNAESDAHALFKIIEFQKALTEQYNITDVVGRRKHLKSALDTAIEKAKPNMDKIDNVDKWLDSIR